MIQTENLVKHFGSFTALNGITCTIRRSRGEDIYAACGMLAGKRKHP